MKYVNVREVNDNILRIDVIRDSRKRKRPILYTLDVKLGLYGHSCVICPFRNRKCNSVCRDIERDTRDYILEKYGWRFVSLTPINITYEIFEN